MRVTILYYYILVIKINTRNYVCDRIKETIKEKSIKLRRVTIHELTETR